MALASTNPGRVMPANWLLIAIAWLVALLALGALACNDDEDSDNEGTGGAAVNVALMEWRIAPKRDSVVAGTITFSVTNIGGIDHDLVIIKSELEPDALPTRGDGSVDEDGAGIEVIDRMAGLEASGEDSLAVALEAGSYVLVCNIVEDAGGTSHYQEGMRMAFAVTE